MIGPDAEALASLLEKAAAAGLKAALDDQGGLPEGAVDMAELSAFLVEVGDGR